MRIITVHCVAKPEYRSELITLCKGMIVPSRSEQGCLHYSFYQDLYEENKYFFYEEWIDQPSIDAHNISRHFLDFQPKFKSFIEGEPEINVHTVE